MSNKYEVIGNHKIYLDQIYYIAYAGGKRELTNSQQKEWNKTIHLPELLKIKEQKKIGLDNNPNVVPLTGMMLMTFVKELNFIPIFDQFFEHSRLLKLTNIIIYESIKAKSYEIALRNFK